jgi:hypothetical protein
MQHIFIDADPAELVAWMRGECTQVAVPPPPNHTTKMFTVTMLRRDAVVIPAALWSETANARSEPLDRK